MNIIRQKILENILRRIIQQGDSSREYRETIKLIYKIHRESFREENDPTAEDYFMELVQDAFKEYNHKTYGYTWGKTLKS